MTFSLIGEVVDAVVWTLSTVGLPGLFALMVVESFGFPPVPSEVILPFSGFLVAQGTFPLGGALAAALLGGLVGSYAGYALGRWGRHRITGLGLGALRIESSHLETMDRFFQKHGEATVGLSRLVPVVRSYISYPAGTAEMEPIRFGAYTLLGATPFTLGLVYAGMLLGSDWSAVSADLASFNLVAIALVVAGVVYVGLLVGGWLTPGWPPRWRPRRSRPGPSGAGSSEPGEGPR